jgi:hypothetical protein
MIWEFAVRCSMGRMGQFQWFQPFHRFATFIIGIEPFQSFQSFHRYARFQLFDELTMSGPNLTTASLCSNRLTRPPPLQPHRFQSFQTQSFRGQIRNLLER